MSIRKRLARSVKGATGGVKKRFGRVTGNRRLSTEGRVDQATANLEQAGAKFTDAFKR